MSGASERASAWSRGRREGRREASWFHIGVASGCSSASKASPSASANFLSLIQRTAGIGAGAAGARQAPGQSRRPRRSSSRASTARLRCQRRPRRGPPRSRQSRPKSTTRRRRWHPGDSHQTPTSPPVPTASSIVTSYIVGEKVLEVWLRRIKLKTGIFCFLTKRVE